MSTKSNVINLSAYKASKGIAPIKGLAINQIIPKDFPGLANDRGNNIATNVTVVKETIWDLYLSVGKLPFKVKHNTSGNIFIVDDILTSGEFMFIPMVNVYGLWHEPSSRASYAFKVPFDNDLFHLV
jgi:hypothetical protein